MFLLTYKFNYYILSLVFKGFKIKEGFMKKKPLSRREFCGECLGTFLLAAITIPFAMISDGVKIGKHIENKNGPSAGGRCSYGADCGGGGGRCSYGADCGGGGGRCSYGADCGGGGGRCSYGASCSGS
jgi:hypothetical protein